MDPNSKARLSRRSLVGAAGAASALALTGSFEHAAAAPGAGTLVSAATHQDASLPTPREQTLVMEQSPNNVWDSFNPFIPNGEAYNYGLAIVCREYMFYVNFLTGEEKPWLAESYSYNADFTEVTLKLNPNVTWSDGEPFTSADVKFTQEMVMGNEALGGSAGLKEEIKSIEAPDPQTVVWTINKPDPRFHYRFLAGVIADNLRVMPKHIWEKEADPATFKFNPPIQTGPYVLKESSSSKLYYLWEKNPSYWNKAELDPAPQYVLYRQGADVDASVQAFLAGNLDTNGSIDYLNQQMIETQYEDTVRFDFPDPCPRGFYFNVDSPTGLFATPEGRWAMSHLIDRETIANVIWQPASRPATYPWADYEGWKKWAPEEVMSKYDLTFNVDKANELLDKLGATERDGDIRVLNGKKLSLTMVTPAQTTGLEYQIGASFANTAKEAGIDIQLKSLPGSAFGDTFYTGQYDISCHWICGMGFDPGTLFDDYGSDKYVPIGQRSDEDGSASRLQSKLMDDALAALEGIDPNDEASMPKFAAALDAYLTELPSVPSIQTTYPFMFNTRYWTGWPTDDDQYAIPANWWGQFLFAIGGLKPAGS
jgi:peptide/nickel transport system substrate-binding protein